MWCRLDAHELVSLFKEEEEAILAKLRQQKKTGQVMQNGTKVEKKLMVLIKMLK